MVLPRAGSQAGSPAVYLLSKHGSSRGCRSEKTSCDRQLGQMNEKGNGKRANQWDTSAQVSPCALHSSKKHHLAHESRDEDGMGVRDVCSRETQSYWLENWTN